MADRKLKIAVIFGGRSGEHAVSLMSARFVLSQLSEEKYQVIQVGITRDGDWYIGSEVQPNVLEALLEGDISQLTQALALPVPSRKGIFTIENAGLLTLFSDIDVVFPVLHGTFGEDGTLQGLLEMANLAYVGPGVTGSSVGMDKMIFYDIMRANGIPVVDTILVLRSDLESDAASEMDRIEAALDAYPMFVKPGNLGSSVGVSKVNSRADLIEGLIEAAAYDRRVVVQRGLNVREIEVSVLGNDYPQASVCGEVLPGADFYSYDAKYHDTRSKTVIPAEIPAQVSDRIRELAIKAYRACDLAGLARVDFFLDKDSGEVYLNELNTIPGFTEISMYPMLWEASGLSNRDLVDKLVDLALERKAQRDATKRTFERNG